MKNSINKLTFFLLSMDVIILVSCLEWLMNKYEYPISIFPMIILALTTISFFN